jgi:hypothetical protein
MRIILDTCSRLQLYVHVAHYRTKTLSCGCGRLWVYRGVLDLQSRSVLSWYLSPFLTQATQHTTLAPASDFAWTRGVSFLFVACVVKSQTHPQKMRLKNLTLPTQF